MSPPAPVVAQRRPNSWGHRRASGGRGRAGTRDASLSYRELARGTAAEHPPSRRGPTRCWIMTTQAAGSIRLFASGLCPNHSTRVWLRRWGVGGGCSGSSRGVLYFGVTFSKRHERIAFPWESPTPKSRAQAQRSTAPTKSHTPRFEAHFPAGCTAPLFYTWKTLSLRPYVLS